MRRRPGTPVLGNGYRHLALAVGVVFGKMTAGGWQSPERGSRKRDGGGMLPRRLLRRCLLLCACTFPACYGGI